MKDLPAVKWKLLNVKKMSEERRRKMAEELKAVFI